MPRPSKDGRAARPPRRRQLTELYVRKVRGEPDGAFNVWDTKQRGLALQVQPSGYRSFKAVYAHAGRPRWYHIGDAAKIGLADARRIAAEVMLAAIQGKDPVADRQAERGTGTFAELAERYVAQYARKHNKSWQQADSLVRRLLLPRWGKLGVDAIHRADVKAMMGRIEAPVLANQVLAAGSAIFTWAVKQDVLKINPCVGIDRNPTRSRERVLSDTEIVRFWAAFDQIDPVRSGALKCILLTGQRPGEVAHMRREHIIDGWWQMLGAPDPKTFWPGTKNGAGHRVWLAEPVQAILAEIDETDVLDDGNATTGFVFAGQRGRPIVGLDAAMREVCAALGVTEKATPHDLRRTFSSRVTGLGFGKDAMNRLTNHKEGGIASVYDRHEYADENRRIMETIAAHILGLVEGRGADGTVVDISSGRGHRRGP
jgi:integrase